MKSSKKPKVVTLGEIMLRLKSPGFERLLQSPQLEATFGGGEANVAVSLSLFGLDSSFVTALPENPLGRSAAGELARHGVDVSGIQWTNGRMGLYFLEAGSSQRPSRVVYDRSDSAMANADPETFPWKAVFRDADWFHITGITPALSADSARVTKEALKQAKAAGLTVSMDLNFRKKLWNYGKTAPEVMIPLMPYVDVIIANEEDCQKSLGMELSGSDITSGTLHGNDYTALCRNVLNRFPKVSKIAITLRESQSASRNGWSALLFDGSKLRKSRHYAIEPIVDRVGSGDSFSAGLIYGLQMLDSEQEALEFAAAASCLKHTIPGDFNLLSTEEVFTLMGGDGSGRVQR